MRLRGGGPMSTQTGWAVLFAATGFELVSTVFMDRAEGFTKPRESLVAVSRATSTSCLPRR